ncbi:MAG TPA: hypothetical protein VHW96_14200 [Solirubrobacteraceae bacterium]|jgi:hypothetical protein|nr:hypothetical protein [Solirubrobacteraceae bacterium]
MANDASQALGASEVAGTLVSPRGLTKKMTMMTAGGQVGGLVGSLAATAMAGKAAKATPEMPSFGRSGYLAASDTELVLTKTSQLGWKPHPKGDALVRVPRGDVQSVELEQGKVLSHLKLTFADGLVWEFEIPRANRKGAKEFTAALGGTVT